MGKSFSKNKRNYSENYERSNSEFKHRKNKVRDEQHAKEEYSEYKIHGFKNDKD